MLDDLENKTIEDYIATYAKNAKAFIYSREHPFLSTSRLNETFGDIAFIQYSGYSWIGNVRTYVPIVQNNSNRTWVLDFYDLKYTYDKEDLIKRKIDEINDKIIRLGSLKCLFSETLEPFQETIQLCMNTETFITWKKEQKYSDADIDKISFFFLNNDLITILNKDFIL